MRTLIEKNTKCDGVKNTQPKAAGEESFATKWEANTDKLGVGELYKEDLPWPSKSKDDDADYRKLAMAIDQSFACGAVLHRYQIIKFIHAGRGYCTAQNIRPLIHADTFVHVCDKS